MIKRRVVSWVVVRFHDADRTITSGRYDVETPHLSCIARRMVMDGVAVRAVFMKYYDELNSVLYTHIAALHSI